MKKIVNLFLCAVISSGIALAPIVEAKVPAEKQEELKKRQKSRGGKALSPRVCKKVQKAFELYQEDKVDEALAILLEMTPKGDFDKANVDRYIGSMYAGIEGKGLEAIAKMKTAVDSDLLPFRDHSELLRNIAALSMQALKYEDAITYYKEYIDFSLDEDDKTYVGIASAYYELKQYDKVIVPAKKSIALQEKLSQNPYILIMDSYYEQKKYKETVKAVENLVKTFPEDSKWWVQLGNFYALVEDYDRALSTFDVSYKNGYLKKDSEMKRLAQLYATNGIPYQAAIIQEKYIKSGLIKKDDNSLSIMASTFQNAKEYDKAATYYGEAAKLTNDADLYRKQGNALMIQEKYKAALVAFDKALKAGFENKGMLNLLIGESNFYLEKWKDAHNAFLEAKKDKGSSRTASSWLPYVKDTASRKGVTL
jgi:tetratricopeptide (TPR) repeat protein